MQDELLEFILQMVWRLVDLPKGKHAIRTKWVYRNKKYERGIDDAQEILDEFYGGAHFLLRVAVKTTSTPIETNKALLNDEEAEDVDDLRYLKEPFNDTYETPKHTQKVFANMRRKGKGFSGIVTSLFQSMLVPQVVEGEGSGQPSKPQPPSSTAPPSQKNKFMLSCTSHTTKDPNTRKAKKSFKTLIYLSTGIKLFKIGTSKRKSLDEEYVSKQGRKSDKIKPMFDDSDFVELDVDNAIENVKGDAKTQRRNTAKQITTNRDIVNTASIDVSAVGPSNVSTADPFTSIVGDIFEDEMMTIVDTLMAIRGTRPRTTLVVICDVEEEPRRATPIPTVQSQDKEIQKLYESEQNWINDFVPIDSEVVKDSRKGKAEGSRQKTVARKRTSEKLDDEKCQKTQE
ncbi:hypothetical protein Tco_0728861 [Tanacetum coccineum]|uniref:Uncharacterized protein n=1 Tax=Tanacetum coccineum TaxID=301880 RepID=A0ABQ4YN82_9ASTR